MNEWLNTRHPETTYRIDDMGEAVKTVLGQPQYRITVYPPKDAPIMIGAYRYDTIPEWLRRCMALEDLTFPDPVPDIGKRIGTTYWVDCATPSAIASLHFIQDVQKGKTK